MQFESSGEKKQPLKLQNTTNHQSLFNLPTVSRAWSTPWSPPKKGWIPKLRFGFCRFAVLGPQISISQWSQKWCKVLIPSHFSFIEETMYQSTIHETSQQKASPWFFVWCHPPPPKKKNNKQSNQQPQPCFFFPGNHPHWKSPHDLQRGWKISKSVNDLSRTQRRKVWSAPESLTSEVQSLLLAFKVGPWVFFGGLSLVIGDVVF